MCALCSNEVSIDFYIDKVNRYTMTPEPHTVEGMMLFIGLNDEKYDNLMQHDDFRAVVEGSGVLLNP